MRSRPKLAVGRALGVAALIAPLSVAAIAGGHAWLLALSLALLAVAAVAAKLRNASRSRDEPSWEELETLASRPLPPPRLRRRAARYARIGALICLAPAVLLGGHEQEELRAAGVLSLVPVVIYVFALYSEYSDRDALLGLAHAALGAAALLAAIGMPRLTDGNAYLTAAVTAPLLIAAVVTGERARRRWHRTDAQTEADMRAIRRRRAQARAAESRRQPR
jgi:membrane protein implicated in regulation of membrane protease activity